MGPSVIEPRYGKKKKSRKCTGFKIIDLCLQIWTFCSDNYGTTEQMKGKLVYPSKLVRAAVFNVLCPRTLARESKG